MISIVALCATVLFISAFHGQTGPQLTPDSSTYLSMARYAMLGEGFGTVASHWNTPADTPPLVNAHHPAGYPIFLILTKALSTDMTSPAGGTVNAVLLGITLWITGLLTYNFTTRTFFAIAAMGLVFSSDVTLFYGYLWSETLFLPLVLCSMMCILQFIRTHKISPLLIAALFLGIAWLVRYVALVFVLITLLIIVFQKIRWRTRLVYGVAFGFVAYIPIGLWYLYLSFQQDTIFNHAYHFYGVFQSLIIFLNGLITIYLNILMANFKDPISLVAATLVIVTVGILYIRQILKQNKCSNILQFVTHVMCSQLGVLLVYWAGYSAFIFLVGSFGNVSFLSRTVLPVYPLAIVILVTVIDRLKMIGQRSLLTLALACVLLIIAAVAGITLAQITITLIVGLMLLGALYVDRMFHPAANVPWRVGGVLIATIFIGDQLGQTLSHPVIAIPRQSDAQQIMVDWLVQADSDVVYTSDPHVLYYDLGDSVTYKILPGIQTPFAQQILGDDEYTLSLLADVISANHGLVIFLEGQATPTLVTEEILLDSGCFELLQSFESGQIYGPIEH